MIKGEFVETRIGKRKQEKNNRKAMSRNSMISFNLCYILITALISIVQ